jgi:F1F0 ATPase subunit 2
MTLLLAAAAGCLFGVVYVGHLWRDMERFVRSGRRSLRWGMLLRISAVGVGFVIMGRTGGPNLIAALAGLLLTRTVLVLRVGRVSDA